MCTPTAVHTWPPGTKETYRVPTSRQEKLDAIYKLVETQTPEGPQPSGRLKWSQEEIEILQKGKCFIHLTLFFAFFSIFFRNAGVWYGYEVFG